MTNPWKGKHGPLLIAEIGGNHEGDFEYAKKLTQLAIESDVDYIKFQIYTGDSLVNKIESPVRNKHFKKFQLTNQQHIQLAQMCRAHGVGYMASVWDLSFISWIDEYMDVYKIGSGDLTAYQVLKGICKTQKPIILSTGLSTLEEVKASVAFIQSCDPIYFSPNKLSILQCTSMYPIPFEEANLAVMNTLSKETLLPIGYSDHTEGCKALSYSVAMGAKILEFHFTDAREGKKFRDHKVSLTKDETLNLISEIKTIYTLQGNGNKEPTPSELDNKHEQSFRRALFMKSNIKKNQIITEDDIISLRPCHGIPANFLNELIGKKANRNITKLEKLDWSFFTK